MASDLSSGCTDDIEIFDEKEEGEISLEDVSSSEESHPNYRPGFQAHGRCSVCTAAQQCAPWCTDAKAMPKTHRKRDAAHGKENRRHIKDSSGTISKHVVVSTLQEKNDDLVPISSDSDMEIVGLPGNSKQLSMRPSAKGAKVRKKKKKKRSHSSVVRAEDMSSPTEVETYLVDLPVVKTVRSSKSRHGEPSSPRYSVRSPPIERPLARSPSRRYKARLLRSRSPLRRSRSPIGPTERKSPRKLRSPRRSPSARASTKSSLLARDHPTVSSAHTYVDIELLKKVRRLESVGAGSPNNKLSKSKEHSSLKEKLSNMLKNKSEPSNERSSARTRGDENSTSVNNNKVPAGAATVEIIDDDDDDIELLRRLALETKQKRSENKSDQASNVNSESNVDNNIDANLSDDNDNEAYELRLIALRSAILKNHENRVKRGVKPKRQRKSKTRVESPFGKSFLDDIPIPDDEVSASGSVERKSPSFEMNEEAAGNNTEDMDLDTDVEREKEKDSMPYSPTDDITKQIAVGDEFPSSEFTDDNGVYDFTHYRNSDEGHDSRDASNYQEGVDTPYSPSAPTKTPTMEISSKPINVNENPCSIYGSDYEPGIDTPYSPPSPTKTPTMEKFSRATGDKDTPCSPCVSDYEPGIDTPYSPPSPTKTSVSTKSSKPTRYVKNPYALDASDFEQGIDTPYSPSKSIAASETRKNSSKSNSNITETPYSPTDTPICDLDVTSPAANDATNLSNDPEIDTKKDVDEKLKNSSALKNLASSMLDLSLDEEEKAALTSMRSEMFSSASNEGDQSESPIFSSSVSMLAAWEDSNKTIESIRAIETLPEVDLDGSPLVPLSKDQEAAEIVIPLEISPERVEPASIEPLYLQGLPDVTRDTNKIPTLVNRTLVPAPILKTNKSLQQRLPRKKSDNHAEPSFKSADMRPVSLESTTVKQSALFKPIKLCPISKKPQVMTTTAAAFNTSFSEDSTRETRTDEELPIGETPVQIGSPPIEATARSPTPDKSRKTDDEDSGRKLRKKRLRRRNSRKRKSTSGREESPSNSSSNQTKSSIGCSKSRLTRDSACSPPSRESVNSKAGPSRSSKRGETKALSSRNDRIDSTEIRTVASPEQSSKKPARKNKKARERDRRSSRKDEAELAPETANGESQASKDVIQPSPGEGTSSGSTTIPSSDLDASKRTERDANETRDGIKSEESTSVAKEQTGINVDAEKKRRCSLDDDEEALRALLLASLPKRQKPAEVSSTPANTIVKTPRLSDSTTTGTSTENSTNKPPKESVPCTPDSVFTPPNPPLLSSQTSSASTATPAKVETAIGSTKNIVVARKILASESSSAESPSLRKRVNVVAPKGPPKKIIKKALPVITSTKVVNNAKKYQNAMLQKKLNLQRAASIYCAQNGSRNITLNNLKINEAARPSSPKIGTSSKIHQQRLIINLGSDSDSESETESPPSNSVSSDVVPEKRQPLAIPITDFEKSLDQFLKDQRKKLESVAVAKTAASTPTTSTSKSPATSATTGNLTGLYSTPLAVRRHLPMSQQEEYRRLKHQIMERERLKLQKTIENGTLSLNRNSKSPCSPPGPLSPASPVAMLQRPDNPKVSVAVSQVATSGVITSSLAASKDSTPNNNLASQKRITVPKGSENQSTVNVTKVSSKVTQVIPNKQLTIPTKPTALSKVEPNNPIVVNNSAKTSAPRVATTIVPKVNTVFESVPKIPASSSTPKVLPKTAQLSPNIVKTNLPLRTSVPPAKLVVSTTRIRRNSGSHAALSFSTNAPVESATKVSSVQDKNRWSLETLSPQSGSSTRRFSAPSSSRTALNPSQMLMIQIPNDRVRIDNAGSMDNSRSPCNSPAISGGMLRVLSTEELNNRFAQMQGKKFPAGRTVTIGSSIASSKDFAQATGSSKFLSELGGKTDNSTRCDVSTIAEENNEARTVNAECSNAARSVNEDTTILSSEVSTLVLLGSEGNSCNETNLDSTASTFVVAQTDPERLDSFESTRTEELIDETLSRKPGGAKATKLQSKEVWEQIKTDVRNELEILTALPIEEQQKLLTQTQQNLVAKRNMVLEDLTEMSGCLRQWEVERDIQTRLMTEVRRLREELKAAEQRLKEQRRQMNGMNPKVTQAHEKINHGRRECYKLTRICQGLGTKVIGEDYKVPSTGAQLLNDRLKEVAVHTRQLSKKKVSPVKSPNDTVVISDNSFTEVSLDTTISERDLDDDRGTTGNSELSMPSDTIMNVLAESTEVPSPISDGSNLVVNDNEDSTSCQVISLTKDAECSTNAEVISSTKETEGSKSVEVISLAKETEGLNSAKVTSPTREAEDPPTKEIEGSTLAACLPKQVEASSSTAIMSPARGNIGRKCGKSRKDEEMSSSDTRIQNNASAKESNDYISLPGTSKSDSHAIQVTSIDQQRRRVSQRVEPYKSVLTHLKMPRSDNPGGILCPYELMGTCNDGDCQFYHLDPGHCQ